MNCIENVAGVIVYPLKRLAIFPYDPDSATAVRTDAWTLNDTITVVHHVTVLAGTTANFVNFVNVQTGLAVLSIVIDPSTLTLPHTLEFGPHGLRFPHGIGLRCLDAATVVHVYYSRDSTS